MKPTWNFEFPNEPALGPPGRSHVSDGELRIALTPGEPAGIGPELVRTLTVNPFPGAVIHVIADRALMSGSLPEPAAGWRFEHVPLAAAVQPGRPDPANADYLLRTLDIAVDGCLAGRFDAMVTGPVQKSTIAAAGHCFSGHTEYLAERCGGMTPVMLLTDGTLNVALVTTHLPLRAVADAVTSDRVHETLAILARDLRARFGVAEPRILVCGLNPHAGESGLLGHEDGEIIAPAVSAARAEGIDAIGPVPADTAFTPASLARADAVLAMYHDQGLPVIKARGFGGIANVTLGLPIIRTSVDHGTALDLAGTGRASADSLAAALRAALRLAGARHGVA